MSGERDSRFGIPPAAHRPKVYYDSTVGYTNGDEVDYGTYRKLGLIPNRDQTAQAALIEARRKWGKKVQVFLTAKWYVAYIVE